MRLQAGARAVQRTARCGDPFFSKPETAQRGNAGLSRISDLAEMLRDEFGHLEHADLALAIKYRPELIVGVDHDSLLFVLKAAPLDVGPQLLGKLRAR
jgi:hypothetical protein